MERQDYDIKVRANHEGFKQGQEFVEKLLRKKRITEEIVLETLLVFETLFSTILEQGFSDDTLITIWNAGTFGDIKIRLGFEGKMYVPSVASAEEDSPEMRILRGFEDKIDTSYHSGYNNISISVKRSFSRTMLFCAVGVILAFVLYIPLSFLLNEENKLYLMNSVVLPVESLFTNAILMVSAPVTFFSLLKNLTDIYIVAERDSRIRSIQRVTLVTSFCAVVFAIAVAFIMLPAIRTYQASLSTYSNLDVDLAPYEWVSSFIPSNIVEPFITISPFPLIIVASITALALTSIGKYFVKIKEAIDVCAALMSKMLSIIMYALPFFSFLCILHFLLGLGARKLIIIILFSFVALLSSFVLLVFYLIRLKINRVDIGNLFRHMPKLLVENLKINSVIDASAYNVRYCSRYFGLDRKRLESELPVLAQINLDGNCYIVTLFSLMILFSSMPTVSWINVAVIGCLILFLSLGAPNQPGSCLIGIMIVINYIGAYKMVPIAIFAEVFFGAILNLLNFIGDIVIVAIDDVACRREEGGIAG